VADVGTRPIGDFTTHLLLNRHRNDH
jgi:hypothetical protein